MVRPLSKTIWRAALRSSPFRGDSGCNDGGAEAVVVDIKAIVGGGGPVTEWRLPCTDGGCHRPGRAQRPRAGPSDRDGPPRRSGGTRHRAVGRRGGTGG